MYTHCYFFFFCLKIKPAAKLQRRCRGGNSVGYGYGACRRCRVIPVPVLFKTAAALAMCPRSHGGGMGGKGTRVHAVDGGGDGGGAAGHIAACDVVHTANGITISPQSAVVITAAAAAVSQSHHNNTFLCDFRFLPEIGRGQISFFFSRNETYGLHSNPPPYPMKIPNYD